MTSVVGMTCVLPPAEILQSVRLPITSARGVAALSTVISFSGLVDAREHIAVVFVPHGSSTADDDPAAPLVRLHSECLTGDVLGSARCDCGEQLDEALERFAQDGGVLLYLRQEGRGIGLYSKLAAYRLLEQGLDTFEANRALGHDDDERDYSAAAQMLIALGLRRVRILSNNPDKAAQLRRLGIDVEKQLATGVYANPHNRRYLQAKAERGDHGILLPPMFRTEDATGSATG